MGVASLDNVLPLLADHLQQLVDEEGGREACHIASRDINPDPADGTLQGAAVIGHQLGQTLQTHCMGTLQQLWAVLRAIVWS